MQRTWFQLDALGEVIVEGFSSGEEWNGWACPYFTYEQAERLVELWERNRWKAAYDGVQDAFVFSVNQDFTTGDSEEFETFPAVSIEGLNYYPIGAFQWTWENASSANIAEPA
jgi:hypothetical protein